MKIPFCISFHVLGSRPFPREGGVYHLDGISIRIVVLKGSSQGHEPHPHSLLAPSRGGMKLRGKVLRILLRNNNNQE